MVSAFEITTDALSGRACKFSFGCSDTVELQPLLAMCVSSLPARQYKHYTIVNMILYSYRNNIIEPVTHRYESD